GRMFMREKATVWRCRNCGCLVEGTHAPDLCPACAHPKAHFEELNYTF
ncbi:rubredoxin-like domain-containing protein, partial [Desulfovibrio sp.]